MKITYYLEVISSWCSLAEPAWAELKTRYGSRVLFEWRIAQMNPSDFGVSTAQYDWFYRRSGMMALRPAMMKTGWFQAARNGIYLAQDLVAEAGRDFGVNDDRIRLALTAAALDEGRKVGELAVAVEVGAKAAGIDPAELRARTEAPETLARIQASTARFHAHQVTQRPTFVLEDAIGDKAVFSGLITFPPLAAAVEAMLADEAGYAAYAAHFGSLPSR
ncbi:MAG: DsbA family oxidoreductase [Opitutaceae bacterium]